MYAEKLDEMLKALKIEDPSLHSKVVQTLYMYAHPEPLVITRELVEKINQLQIPSIALSREELAVVVELSRVKGVTLIWNEDDTLKEVQGVRLKRIK